MCSNYQPPRPEQFQLLDLPQPTFDFNPEAYPRRLGPMIVKGQDAEMELREAMFGLVPHWAKDTKFAANTYNAKSETVTEKASYRKAWRENQFALIPMISFYEPNYETGVSVRWRIERDDLEPFTAAAIWDTCNLLDKEDIPYLLRSFSMMTINADGHPLMSKFHNPIDDEKRSIVVIPPDLRHDWLNADHRTAKELLNEIIAEQFHGLPDPLPPRAPAQPKPPKITKKNSDDKSMNMNLF
jgi:putative SOS response-associated peptidase YedK